MNFVNWSTAFVGDTTCPAILPTSFTHSVTKSISSLLYSSIQLEFISQLRPTPRCELRLHARDVLVSEPKVPVVRHVHQGRAKILRHIHRSISISVTPILSKTHADRVPNSEGLVHTLHVSINRIILNGTYSSITYSAYLERCMTYVN